MHGAQLRRRNVELRGGRGGDLIHMPLKRLEGIEVEVTRRRLRKGSRNGRLHSLSAQSGQRPPPCCFILARGGCQVVRLRSEPGGWWCRECREQGRFGRHGILRYWREWRPSRRLHNVREVDMAHDVVLGSRGGEPHRLGCRGRLMTISKECGGTAVAFFSLSLCGLASLGHPLPHHEHHLPPPLCLDGPLWTTAAPAAL